MIGVISIFVENLTNQTEISAKNLASPPIGRVRGGGGLRVFS